MNFAWFRYLSQMAPWLTILLIAVLFVFLQGSLAPVPSLLFDLPSAGAADSAQPGLVALLIPGIWKARSPTGLWCILTMPGMSCQTGHPWMSFRTGWGRGLLRRSAVC